MSLDNIRQFLEQDRYEQEKYVIWDMKKIFLNAMSYFSVSINSKIIKHVMLNKQ